MLFCICGRRKDSVYCLEINICDFLRTETLLSCTLVFPFHKAIIISDCQELIDDNFPVISSHF